MPKPRPPRLWRVRTRHGRMVWYVCTQRGGKRIRINHEYGTPEFEAAYQEALNGVAPDAPRSKATAGSLAWLIERYRGTTDWAGLSPATRRQRENIFKQVAETAGKSPYSAITAAII